MCDMLMKQGLAVASVETTTALTQPPLGGAMSVAVVQSVCRCYRIVCGWPPFGRVFDFIGGCLRCVVESYLLTELSVLQEKVFVRWLAASGLCGLPLF